MCGARIQYLTAPLDLAGCVVSSFLRLLFAPRGAAEPLAQSWLSPRARPSFSGVKAMCRRFLARLPSRDGCETGALAARRSLSGDHPLGSPGIFLGSSGGSSASARPASACNVLCCALDPDPEDSTVAGDWVATLSPNNFVCTRVCLSPQVPLVCVKINSFAKTSFWWRRCAGSGPVSGLQGVAFLCMQRWCSGVFPL